MDTQPIIRKATQADIEPLAKLWHDGWHDGHRALAPEGLLQFRTLESFIERMGPMLPDTRVSGAPSEPTGFCFIMDDEIDQMYVSPVARGTGVAARLLADGEERLRHNGIELAWLSCAAGNERAARFYERTGWTSTREPEPEELKGAPGLTIDVWRYSKRLV